jgi:hypothetical protein
MATYGLPVEPIEIGDRPQFVFDNYVIDNHWAIKYKREAVRQVFHQATKHPGNPIFGQGDQPSFNWVIRDEEDGLFKMWYQLNDQVAGDKAKGRKYNTHIAYAQSKDGIRWEKPDLGLFKAYKKKPNNIVLGWDEYPNAQTCTPCILEVPEADSQDYRFLMMYRAKGAGIGPISGIRLIGSNDGIHWDFKSDKRLAHLHSDHFNTVVFDPNRKEYVMYCRPKHIYRTFRGEMVDTGASRRVARMASKSLWTDWLETVEPQTLLIPDNQDSETHFNFYYGMAVRYHGGIYWGFIEPFRMNDYIYTELAVSRDGIHFQRMPGRPKIVEWGEEGSWDDTMIFMSPSWVEVGDEWWLYYSGWDGPHGTTERTGAYGMAKIRKEGFCGMKGPKSGGVLCSRKIKWSAGKLLVNAVATGGKMQVRISDEKRKPLEGFNYDDCEVFSGDSTSHEIKWKSESIESLKGQVIRLEFYLQEAELFTFKGE